MFKNILKTWELLPRIYFGWYSDTHSTLLLIFSRYKSWLKGIETN